MRDAAGNKERERLLELLGPALADYTPVIEELDVVAAAGGAGVHAIQLDFVAEFDFTDLDGDIELVEGRMSSNPPYTFTDPAAQWEIHGDTSGRAHETLSVGAGYDTLEVYVTDENGNDSNTLTLTFR